MTQTAQNYGDALYDLAHDEGLDQPILTQLLRVEEILAAEPAYLELLSCPSIPKTERCQALDEAFGGRVHSYVLSFLKLLCERGHIRSARECIRRYRSRYNRDRGIVEAVAVTAVPLTPALRARLEQKLAQTTGKQISLRNRVDPTVLGGVRLELEGTQLDGTVRRALDGLRKTLSDTVL